MARLLNGTNETAVFVADPIGPLDITGSTMILSAWVKPTAGYTSATRVICAKSISGTTQYVLYLNPTTGTASLAVNNTEGVTGSTGLTAGVWTHLMGTKVGNGGANQLGMWVNGTLDGLGSSSNSIPDTGQSFRIGSNDNGTYFAGSIAEVALWAGVVATATMAPRLYAGQNPLGMTEFLPYLKGYIPVWGAGNEPNFAPGTNQVLTFTSTGGIKSDHPPVVPAWLH